MHNKILCQGTAKELESWWTTHVYLKRGHGCMTAEPFVSGVVCCECRAARDASHVNGSVVGGIRCCYGSTSRVTRYIIWLSFGIALHGPMATPDHPRVPAAIWADRIREYVLFRCVLFQSPRRSDVQETGEPTMSRYSAGPLLRQSATYLT